MNKNLLLALALSTLTLSGCKKSFGVDTPLFDKTEGTEYASLAYLKTADHTFSQVASEVSVAQNGTNVTTFTQQDYFVYLTKPATEDVTVTVSLDESATILDTYRTRHLSSNPGYRLAPEGYAKLSATTVTIPKGQTKSSTAVGVLPGDKYNEVSQASGKKDYFVIPLKITAVAGSSSVGVSQKYDTYFIPVVKNYQNVSYYSRDPHGTMLTASDVDYEVSTEYEWSGWTYKKDFLYDNDTQNEWYADRADPEPWVSVILKNGKKKFSYILFRGSPVDMTKSRDLEVFITQDGENWIPQGILPTASINNGNFRVIKFLNPIEAKGVKFIGRNPTGTGSFAIAELNFFAED